MPVNTFSDHRNSLSPQQAFVAFFDVLGFQSRLRQVGLREVLHAYNSLVEMKEQADRLSVFSSEGVLFTRVGSTIFSDSILFWCYDHSGSVQKLFNAAAFLIAAAIDIRWPLRGGLAYGECVLDPQTSTFIGQPIIDAYNTEESQQWIGAGLHVSILQHLLLGGSTGMGKDVIEYEVPTKKGQPGLTHAIHWCPYSRHARVSIGEMKHSVNEKKIKTYYDLTLAYVADKCAGTTAPQTGPKQI
jgi:hypothetical protein